MKTNRTGGPVKITGELSAAQFRRDHVDQVEHNIQSTCVEWFDLQYVGLLLYAVPNGGKRDKVTAGKMRAEGVRRGIPDLHLAVVTSEYAGLYIETKTPAGRPSDAQLLCHAYLRGQGYEVVIVGNLEEFQDAVWSYLKYP